MELVVHSARKFSLHGFFLLAIKRKERKVKAEIILAVGELVHDYTGIESIKLTQDIGRTGNRSATVTGKISA